MSVSYHMEVYGRAWQGFKAAYQYTLTENKALAIVAGDTRAIRSAPDFAEVLDYRIVRETCTYSEPSRGVSVRTDRFETLRSFRNGMTPARFHRMINR